MTKLVFVHGINQEGKSSESLTDEWSEHLDAALAALGYAGPIDPAVPFYGDRLYQLTNGDDMDHVSPQGTRDGADADDKEAEFLAKSLAEIVAADPRVDAGDVAQEAARENVDLVTAQGFPMHRRINAVVRVIERISPLHGEWVLKLLRQANTYLKQPGAADEIEAVVAPHLAQGPAVIVAHSLGTIVSYRILRRMALEGRPLNVPLFVTVGSPLSLMTVRRALGPAWTRPDGVARWLNAYDPDDFISLGQGLTPKMFTGDIENVGDVTNLPKNAHAIDGYLRDPRVAEAIRDALLPPI